MILLYAVTPKKMFLLGFVTLKKTPINFSDIEWRKEFIEKVAINKPSLLARETAPFYARAKFFEKILKIPLTNKNNVV
jgi:hypothetical protein